MIGNGIMKSIGRVLAAVALTALVVGCDRSDEQREFQWFPDMYSNPAIKAQETYAFYEDNNGMRMPPANTVARGEGKRPYPFSIPEREKARVLENPVPLTRESLETGKKYFNIHCRPCHGVVGSGDGLVTQVHRENGFVVPPSLYSDKIRDEWKDGEIYHNITMGQGQMAGYGSRITEENRWAIVHYVRALGVAANPTEEDLETAQRRGLDAQSEDDPYKVLDPTKQLYLGSMKPKYGSE